MSVECVNCYVLFEPRPDAPELRLCTECSPNGDVGYGCPKCGWQCDPGPDARFEVKNWKPDWEFSYIGGAHWTEVWTCPECSEIFEQENSSV